MPYSFCAELEGFGLFLTTTTNITALCALCVIAYGIKQSFSNALRQLAPLKSFLITYYITCFLWIISIIAYATVSIIPYTNICSNIALVNFIGTIFGFNGYFGSLIGIYLLFILRLKFIFVDHSVLKISNCKYRLLLSGVFVQTFIFIIACYLLTSFHWMLGAMLIYLFSITNALYSIILLLAFWTFVFKRHRSSASQSNINHKTEASNKLDPTPTTAVITSTAVTEHDTYTHKDATDLFTITSSVSGPSVTQNIETQHVHHPYNELAESIVKYTLCVLCMLLSTMTANVVAFYRGFIHDTMLILRIHIALVMLDMFVNILCLHLQFQFAKGYYMKCYGGCLRQRMKTYVLRRFDAYKGAKL